MTFRTLTLAFTLPLVAACAIAGGYQADLTSQTVQPSTMMVAKPLPLTLVIVMDPEKVADMISIQNSSHSMKGFRPFFADGLKKTLAPYFTKVAIVAPGYTPPAEVYAIADVRLDGIEARPIVTGRLTYVILHQQWSFAIRPSNADEYLFSYSGVGTSDSSYATLDMGAKQMMTSSLGGLLKGWTEKDVMGLFKAYDAEQPAPAAPPEEGTTDA